MSERAATIRIRTFLFVLTAGLAVGCEAANPPAAPARPAVPLAIHRPPSGLLVFSGDGEMPGTSYNFFEGSQGSVRVTMEVEGASASSPNVPLINDVLFKAEGSGRLSVAFKRPSPDLPNGQVIIRCLSGEEESTAVFEPELWYHMPGAIVTLEPTAGDPADPPAPGKEIVLWRYVARNIPRDVRLTFKAVFSEKPIPPRTKAGPKGPAPIRGGDARREAPDPAKSAGPR